MRTTKIKIKNLFGIAETELNGQSVEITGKNGTGKTSIIDSIRYALTNSSKRDYIIKKGENEGEIIVETDAGIYIDRKKRAEQADYKSVKDNGRDVTSPENFIATLFTPLQLDPVAFTQMTKKEQNRVILDLIEFDWDLNWIKRQFGEIPEWVNYQQNILQVLNDIQADNGQYFQMRQDVNRDIRNKNAFVQDISKDIPDHYDAEYWENYDMGEGYKKIARIKEENNLIERAKIFKDTYKDKIRGIQAEKEMSISAEEKTIANERETLLSGIERMKAEIKASEDKLSGLSSKLQDKILVHESKYNEQLAKLDSDIQVAEKYANKESESYEELEAEMETAEQMKKHLNEYKRMTQMIEEIEKLESTAADLTTKIEIARNLPGEILKTATIPIKGFAVENGIPLINGLPVSNLSEGEQLDLCVDVALSKPNSLQIILIDGAEKLSDENRDKLYQKCKDKGLQFIATRTTNSDEMEINYL